MKQIQIFYFKTTRYLIISWQNSIFITFFAWLYLEGRWIFLYYNFRWLLFHSDPPCPCNFECDSTIYITTTKWQMLYSKILWGKNIICIILKYILMHTNKSRVYYIKIIFENSLVLLFPNGSFFWILNSWKIIVVHYSEWIFLSIFFIIRFFNRSSLPLKMNGWPSIPVIQKETTKYVLTLKSIRHKSF